MKISRKIIFWTGAAAAVAALAWVALREPVQMASVAQVQRGPLELNFLEEGKTRLKNRYLVTAPVAGLVRRIELRPGDAVQAGQVVAHLDPATSALLDPRARAQARADIATAQSALRSAHERIAAASTELAVAQREYQRQDSLRKDGMTTATLLDSTRARAAQAQAALTTARADEQIAQQRLQVARASLALDGSAGSGKALTLTAPVQGVVLKRAVESATPVPAGQVLLEIGNPAQLEIEVEALSTDAVTLRPGLKARVLRWGGEGVLDATVTRIEPGGFTKVSALGVDEQRTRVILDFTSPQAKWAALGDGYRVEVEFIQRQEKDVLQVPVNALFRAGDGWAVYGVDGGRALKLPVTIGARSATAAEVIGGLSAGQSVIVQPDDRIKEGTRIQAVSGN
ncbi:MAG: HlyD family efflux transporter periplasmic adaptor subunit [Burkholderiaceae bacterium]|nr:HlyD family efflux transporter periplasmic adaptor subunit [Burkholderiaceae bacterium]